MLHHLLAYMDPCSTLGSLSSLQRTDVCSRAECGDTTLLCKPLRPAPAPYVDTAMQSGLGDTVDLELPDSDFV